MKRVDARRDKANRLVFEKAVAAIGYSELARRLKVSLSTCHGWHRRNRVPPWRSPDLKAIAAQVVKNGKLDHTRTETLPRVSRRKKVT